MQISPCKSCTAVCSEENMCDAWREWYAGAWDRARYSLGLRPPKSGSGKTPMYTYEVRDAEDGSVLCRGRAEDCAAELGMDVSTVRRAGACGTLLRKRLRVTRLRVGGDQR